MYIRSIYVCLYSLCSLISICLYTVRWIGGGPLRQPIRIPGCSKSKKKYKIPPFYTKTMTSTAENYILANDLGKE